MERVGIVTIVHNALDESFGPAMQIFATQKVLRDMGFAPETIEDKTARRSMSEKIRRGLDELKKGPSSIGYIFSKGVSRAPNRLSNGVTDEQRDCVQKRRASYSRFISEYVTMSDLIDADLYEGNGRLEEFAFFAVGSDQVWNPYYPQKDSVKYLQFCPQEKRIAFVPSIARNDIPKRFRKGFGQGVASFPHLCVREDAGAVLIKKYAGREATVLVDPTMMLPCETYRGMASRAPARPDGSYVFSYFMGVDNYESTVDELARILAATSMRMRDFGYPAYYTMNPCEYIDAIDNSTLVCTDSFHIAVFSIMLHKPVLVFPRDEGGVIATGSRLETLLKLFGMESSFYVDDMDLDRLFRVNEDLIDSVLCSERRRAELYFQKAFEG